MDCLLLLSIIHNYAFVFCLFTEEIVKEVKSNGKNLTELLKSGMEKLEPNCINRALEAATRNNNHLHIAKLILKNPTNLEECLEIARLEKMAYSRAALLLVVAALTNDVAIVQTLFGNGEIVPGFPDQHNDEGFNEVRKAIASGKISNIASLDLARKYRNYKVQEKLLMQTDVHQREGIVRWQGLGLIEVKQKWLRNICWVKMLKLARNGLRRLPNDMTVLMQVRKNVYVHLCMCISDSYITRSVYI